MTDVRLILRSLASSPTDSGYLIGTCLSLAAAATGAFSNPAFALIACVTSGALLVPVTLRVRAAERLATNLCEGTGRQRMTLAKALPHLAEQLASLEHRAARQHPVTGLPTREILLSAIATEVAKPCQRLLGIIRFADFDRLAAFDPATADQALLSFSDRLIVAVGSAHLLVHVDRDAFAIWFRSDRTAAAAEFRAILYVAGQDLALNAQLLSPVVEAASAEARGKVEPLQLLMRANAALTRIGRDPAGEIVTSASLTDADVRDRFQLEQDLAQAIAREELTMVFQPIVDLAARRLIGAEALIRWQHPERGAISPSVFIPIVEEAGMSERYGMWTLNAACREARRWADEGLSDLRVAVNLSARQLLDDQLLVKIGRTLARHGLPATAIELELTETAAMVRTARTVDLFRRLSDLGISLAIDDFGSGYSSLSHLKNLPFNKLKIDREFVTRLQDRRDSQAICKALIELGRGLNLVVLAEGVEDAEEVAVLRSLGCSVFQGYHFSRPLAGDEFCRLAHDPAWRASLGIPISDRIEPLEGLRTE
jgi:EAL domain-containing protein (putative c-di-GMP-specific phosphodiesterase class I)/GGDEF domain-containing protein